MVLSTSHSIDVALSGLYQDLAAREYAILQDEIDRDADGIVAHVRVMRQRLPYVQAGTIRIPDSAFAGAAADADRSNAVSRALILWLEHRSMRLRFALRVSAVHAENGSIGVRFEESPVQSS